VKSAPLSIFAGREAAARLAREGWQSDLFHRLLGASGGPKWLILGRLDRFLFGEFLPARRSRPLDAIGSSIGAWRHATLAQENPAATIQRFEDIYLDWDYSERPDAQEISDASLTMLEVLLDGGAKRLVEHPWLRSYIVTARGRGPASARSNVVLGPTLAAAGFGNAASRQLLPALFQRVIFTSAGSPALPLDDFATVHCPLTEETVAPALHATGSIPLLLRGERDIAGAPQGHYWDGGIIDYHFDPAPLTDAGLVLYPHFRGDLTTGWFDKFLPWRRYREPQLDRMVLICPSEAFIASLPQGKIPDRSDFTRMSPDARRRYWRQCIDRSGELAEAFAEQVAGGDPLRGVVVVGNG
jgi:hypothetical protein